MLPSNEILIEKISYDCPICDEIHIIEIRKRKTKGLIKNETIEYEEIIYYCENEDDEFTPGDILDENLLRARDAFRLAHGLLTSSELKTIRKEYNLTQKEFSSILGWGDITIQRYEKKSIQDETYDKIMRMFYENPIFALELIDKHKELVDEARYAELRNLIKLKIKTNGNLELKLQEIKNSYIDYEELSDSNGLMQLNLKKVNEIMVYYANSINLLYKVKLLKLLWYTDALYYKKYGTSMTGLVYKHLPLGAVPIGYEEILSFTSIKVDEEYNNHYTAYRITAKEPTNFHSFTSQEIECLQEVFEFFKNKNTNFVVEYMHDEKAYLCTSSDEIIPYSLAGEIREFNI